MTGVPEKISARRETTADSPIHGSGRLGISAFLTFQVCVSLLPLSFACPHAIAQESSSAKSNTSIEGPNHSYLSGSPSSDMASPTFLEGNYALGDWGGLRSKLLESGVVPTVILISDPFGNVHGGEQTGAASYSLAGIDVRLDTERLMGWRGGQFDIGGAVNFGTSLSRSYVGNSFPIQLADCAEAQPRLTYLYYTQTFANEHANLLVGRISLNSVFGEEFGGSEYFKSFVTIGFDLVPQGLFLNVAGASGYPHATWGTRLRFSPVKRFYVQGAAYNADTKQLEGYQHGIDFSIRGPVFTVGEIGFKHFASSDDIKPSGNVKAGGFYTGGTQRTVRNGVEQPVKGLYAFYAVADQQLFKLKTPNATSRAKLELSRWGDAEQDRHVAGFASVVVVPEARTGVVPYFFNVGVIGYGLSAQRPKDFVGAGFVYGSNSRGPTSLIPAGPTTASTFSSLRTPPDQQTLEVNYGWAVHPGVLFQPDLQYIIHPNGLNSIPNHLPPGSGVPSALALGANVVINF